MLCLLQPASEYGKNICPKIPEYVPGKLYYKAPEKHLSDSFVEQRGDELLILEGIIANGKRLVNAYAAQDLKDLLWQATKDTSILGKLHGYFFAARYNVVSGEFRIFTGPASSVRLYYYHQGDTIIVADKIKIIVDVLAASGVQCSVSDLGARMILSYGYMLEGFTTIKEVKQLPSASCLSYVRGRLEEKRYFSWNFEIRHQANHKCYRELTQLLTAAVSDAFERDENYEHLAFLSGGLDSRMVVYIADKLGYKGFSVLSISEPGYLDATIAADIAKELGLKLHFSSLEGGEYLYGLGENLQYHEGQIVMHGAAHLFSALQDMPLERYGILHSGQIGDIVKGTYLAGRTHTPVNPVAAAYSTTILQRFSSELGFVREKYPNHEAFVLYNRGLNGMINGDLATYHFSHSLSAFTEPEFMQYALNIDPAKRYDSRAYLAWMNYSFPVAARHTWEKTGARASDPYWFVKLKYNVWRGSDTIKRMITKQPNRLTMNPFDYWWQSNAELRAHLNQEFSCLQEVAPFLDKELQADMNELFQSSSLSVKLQAYTLARSILYLLGKEDKIEVSHD
ncbi:MAG: asparagine synthase-related protein [Candidatus Cloacimonetes bacterium]|nr:asparagine synthase-related protein [Candidatus Cloacimonadota bacterium]